MNNYTQLDAANSPAATYNGAERLQRRRFLASSAHLVGGYALGCAVPPLVRTANAAAGTKSRAGLINAAELACGDGNLNYATESGHVVDYDLWCLPGIPYYLRGPRCHFNQGTPRIAYLGAAQTFGTFVKYPFPSLLGDMLSCETLNLGRGGAGPGFYNRLPATISYANESSASVVQVMSARSSAVNRHMRTTHGLASVEILTGSKRGERLLGHLALKHLYRELSKQQFIAMIEETLQNYLDQYRTLADAITVPKVLLFIAKHAPLETSSLNTAYDKGLPSLVGAHPHLVSRRLLDELSGLFDATVVIHSKEGSSRRLLNRLTGNYVSIYRRPGYSVKTHSAYAAPYLHTSSALALYEEVKRLV